MFGLDLVLSTITIFYVKLPISDLIIYLGALYGLYKNYRANMDIYEKIADQNHMIGQDREEFIKKSRTDYIMQNAKAKFLVIEEAAKKTENKIDDKLVEYTKIFVESMQGLFGAPPSEAEKKLMEEKAFQYAVERKIAEGKYVGPIDSPFVPSTDIVTAPLLHAVSSVGTPEDNQPSRILHSKA